LKGRFQSLKELRHPINTERQLKIAVAWIQCCIILHNMIIRFETNRNANTMDWALDEGRDLTAEQAEEEEGDEVVGDNSYEGTAGQAHREHLMNQLFDGPHSTVQRRAG
jgi:hypothetical protein